MTKKSIENSKEEVYSCLLTQTKFLELYKKKT